MWRIGELGIPACTKRCLRTRVAKKDTIRASILDATHQRQGWNGNLLIAARRGSLLLRVGKDNEAWANQIHGVATAIMGGRRMSGWVRATPEAYANDALQKLVDATLQFTGSLPKKQQ